MRHATSVVSCSNVQVGLRLSTLFMHCTPLWCCRVCISINNGTTLFILHCYDIMLHNTQCLLLLHALLVELTLLLAVLYLVHTTQARSLSCTYGGLGMPKLQSTEVWYICAVLMSAPRPGRACASLSIHTYIELPLWPWRSDISHPVYSEVHPPGHRSVPGIMSWAERVVTWQAAHGTLWSCRELRPLPPVSYSVP